MKVNLINKSNNPNPKYATDGSAGFDLQANIDGNNVVCIEPNETKLISTGLYFEIPKGYKLSILSRSSLSLKGRVVANSPGLIDSDYRGELKIILRNTSLERFYIKNGERIAQGVLEKHETAVFENVEFLSETERGSGGFGSTDAKVTELKKLKIGDMLIAKDVYAGFHNGTKTQNALMVGKQYSVNGFHDNNSNLFCVCSEVLEEHYFSTDKAKYLYFGKFFDIA
jgi:dUTP pyrophosphatase